MYGHIKPRKDRTRFLEFCRYLRSLYPSDVRIAIICDNFSPHLTTRKDKRVRQWAAASNAEIAYTPTNCSWLNRIEAQFTALRYFALDGTDLGRPALSGQLYLCYFMLDPATEVPPEDVLDRRQWRVPPYLYSPQEVTALTPRT